MSSRAPLRNLGYGFLYWVLFLVALEPGNVLHAVSAGYELAFDREVLRIAAAAMLGASVTPVLLLLTRSLPVIGPERWRNALTHFAAAIVLSFTLNVVSCVPAAWMFARKALPSAADIAGQLAGNWLLLIFALLALTAILHAVQFLQQAAGHMGEGQAKLTARVPVKKRGHLHFVDLQDVDWIETQGNYLVLHADTTTHLIRQTLARLEVELDPQRFVRIHRRTIVAVNRIRQIDPLANGDAVIRLVDGCELRMSRRYREAARAKWQALQER